MGLGGYEIAASDFVQNDNNRHSSFEVGVISRFPLDSVTENDPSADNSRGEPFEFKMRSPLAGRAEYSSISTSRGFLRVRISELKLILHVTHLKSSNGNEGRRDLDNSRKRELVAAAIVDQVRRDRTGRPDHTVLVAGDMNIGETDERKNGFDLEEDETAFEADGRDRYDDTHAIYSSGLIGGVRMISKTHDLGVETFDSDDFAGSGPIDSIYVLGPEEGNITAATRGSSTFGSDHFPVWVDFQWTP